MIELAAAVWKVSPGKALIKARNAGLDIPRSAALAAPLLAYRQHQFAPRERTRAFWATCQDYFVRAEAPSIRGLQHLLGLKGALGRSWQHRGAPFVGGINLTRARRFITPSETPEPGSSRQVLRGSRYFKGRGWQDLMVLPAYDLPGRICGFYFIGRQTQPGDVEYHRAPEFNKRWLGPEKQGAAAQLFESGIMMPAAAFQRSHRLFGSTVFVLDDPFLALRLQIRYMQSTNIPFPMVAFYRDKNHAPRNVWDWLPRGSLVFWSQEPDVAMIAMAQKSHGSVAVRHVSAAEYERNMRTRAVDRWFQLIKCESKPWEYALREQLRRAAADRLEEMLVELGYTGPQLRDFITSCDTALAAKLQAVHDGQARLRRITYGRHVLREDETGWYIESGPQICDVVVRIEQVLRTADERSYYRGVVLFQGDTIPFVEQTASLDRSLWKWARQFLAGKGKGIPTFVTSWGKSAMDIALRFCTPDIVTGADRVGWDAVRRQFNMPGYAIRVPNEIVEDYACLFTDDDVPARLLPKPEPLGTPALQVLSGGNDEVRVFWATAACVVHNILTRAMRFPPQEILLAGAGAQSIGSDTAQHLGCVRVDIGSKIAEIAQALNKHYRHDWPVLFQWQRGLSTGLLNDYFSTTANRQAILPIDAAAAHVWATRQHGHIIRNTRKLGPMQLLSKIAPKVLPSYLFDLCGRRFFICNRWNSMADNILTDMATWFHRQGGSPGVLEQARDIMEVPGRYSAADHFVALLHCLHQTERLTKVRDDFSGVPSGEHLHFIVLTQDQIWIPQQDIADLTLDVTGMPLSLTAVTQALEQCNALLGEPERMQRRGWLISDDWFGPVWAKLDSRPVD